MKVLLRMFLLLIICCPVLDLMAQNAKYWVYFSDKAEVKFDPYTYFDTKAIERRLKHDIPIYHISDVPVSEVYIAAVENVVDSVSYATRWFNAVCVYASVVQIEKLQQLEFVKQTSLMMGTAELARNSKEPTYTADLTAQSKELMKNQVERFAPAAFDEKNLDGRGVRIAIFDAGFPEVDTHPALAHIRNDNRIVKTFDFIKKKEFVYGYDSHGLSVMSCIGGQLNGERMGLATGAEYMLARTEIGNREPFAEEEFWLAAVEWADKHGADLINSSLGYTHHRYFTSDMDGQTSLVAKAANLAAAKGILVVNAAGNDGSAKWKKVGTPGDADSVLTVGGIDPYTNFHIGFSSYGPTADKRMKPNLTAFGHALVAEKGGFGEADGTSFATPLLSGFAACALQADETVKCMDLFSKLEQSGELYPYFDYAHGYGVPQADHFMGVNTTALPTFKLKNSGKAWSVVVNDEFVTTAPTEYATLEKAVKEEVGEQEYVFYHIRNSRGHVRKYYVLKVEQKVPLTVYEYEFEAGEIISLHYRGYTIEHEF